MRPSKSRLCSSVHLSQIVVWYTVTGLYITLHSSPARLGGIHPVQIHLITAVSVTRGGGTRHMKWVGMMLLRNFELNP